MHLRLEKNLASLHSYLYHRAAYEKETYNLDASFYQHAFDDGIREFFGVYLDDEGRIMFDMQEPYEGFLSNFLNTQ